MGQCEERLEELTGGRPVSPSNFQVVEGYSAIRVESREFFMGQGPAGFEEALDGLGEKLSSPRSGGALLAGVVLAQVQSMTPSVAATDSG